MVHPDWVGWRVRGRNLDVVENLEEYVGYIATLFNGIRGEMTFIGYHIPRRYPILVPPVRVGEKYVDSLYRVTLDYVTWVFAPENLRSVVEERFGSVMEVEEGRYEDFFCVTGVWKNILVGFPYSFYVNKEFDAVPLFGAKLYVAYKYGLPFRADVALDMLFRIVSTVVEGRGGRKELLFDAWRLWIKAFPRASLQLSDILKRLKEVGASEKNEVWQILRGLVDAVESGRLYPFLVNLTFMRLFPADIWLDRDKVRKMIKDRSLGNRVAKVVVEKKILEDVREFEARLDDRMVTTQTQYGLLWGLSPDTVQLVALGKPEVLPKFIVTHNLLAFYYPFSSAFVESEGGVYLGHAVRGYDIVVDPFFAPSYNWVVTGMTGTGKSTILKYLTYSLYRYFRETLKEDLLVFLIDPQTEYMVLARLIGADYIDVFDRSVTLGLDPVRLYHEGVIPSLPYVVSVLEDMIQSRLKREVSIAGDINYILRRGVDNLNDLAEALIESGKEAEGKALLYVHDLYPHVFEGSFRFRDKVVYGIPGFASVTGGEIVKTIARLVILPYWTFYLREETRDKYKLLGIDEVQVFLSTQFTCEMVRQMYATARKYNIAVVTATQNPATYVDLQSKFGLPDSVLMNSYFKVVLGMESAVIPRVARILNTPESLLKRWCLISEVQRKLPQGTGLFYRGSDITPFVLNLNAIHPDLVKYFGSKPKEMKEAMRMLDEVYGAVVSIEELAERIVKG